MLGLAQENSTAVQQTGDQAVQKLEQGTNAAMRRVLTAASQATERLDEVSSVTKWKDRGLGSVAFLSCGFREIAIAAFRCIHGIAAYIGISG